MLLVLLARQNKNKIRLLIILILSFRLSVRMFELILTLHLYPVNRAILLWRHALDRHCSQYIVDSPVVPRRTCPLYVQQCV